MNEVRKEQTEQELRRVAAAIEAWLELRSDADRHGYHLTHLSALRSTLLGAAGVLRANLAALDLARSAGEVYDDCRDYDVAIVWLQRLWEYFRTRLDQRDDPERLGPLLEVADEVVWSCYSPVLRRARARERSVSPKAAPLPFVAPEYSPAAVQSDRPLPAGLGLDANLDFLGDYVRSLPVPLLRLPPWCVDSPWWLVYVAHEVGHHLQHDLGLVGHVREGLLAAASKAGLPAAEQKAWAGWGEEVFADAYSVLAMGPAAIWAMAEVERSTPAEMTRPRPLYPAPVIRIALMAGLAREVGVDVGDTLDGIPMNDLLHADPRLHRDHAFVADVVAFVRRPLPGALGTLETLCDLGGGSAAEVEPRARLLRSQQSLSVRREVSAARTMVCGALAVWRDIAAEPDPATRGLRGRALAARTRAAVLQGAPPGTRAVGAVATRPDLGRSLAERLLAAGRRPAGDA